MITSKRRMARMNSAEMREIATLDPVVLVPLGSYEDQGPFAPMGDYLVAEKITDVIANASSEEGTLALVTPVLPFGGADFFGSMPGAISLSQSTIVAVLDDIFSCLLRHGFKKIIVVNGHGGNVAAIQQSTLKIRHQQGVIIPSFYLWQVGYQLLPKLFGQDYAKATAGHGANPLTSVAMHLLPELTSEVGNSEVESPRTFLDLPVSGFGSVHFEGVDIQVPVELDDIAPDGVFNADPSLCSPDKGALITQAIVKIATKFVAHYAGGTSKTP